MDIKGPYRMKICELQYECRISFQKWYDINTTYKMEAVTNIVKIWKLMKKIIYKEIG